MISDRDVRALLATLRHQESCDSSFLRFVETAAAGNWVPGQPVPVLTICRRKPGSPVDLMGNGYALTTVDVAMVASVVAAAGEGLEMYLDSIRAMKEAIQEGHTAGHAAEVASKMKSLWHDIRLLAFERAVSTEAPCDPANLVLYRACHSSAGVVEDAGGLLERVQRTAGTDAICEWVQRLSKAPRSPNPRWPVSAVPVATLGAPAMPLQLERDGGARDTAVPGGAISAGALGTPEGDDAPEADSCGSNAVLGAAGRGQSGQFGLQPPRQRGRARGRGGSIRGRGLQQPAPVQRGARGGSRRGAAAVAQVLSRNPPAPGVPSAVGDPPAAWNPLPPRLAVTSRPASPPPRSVGCIPPPFQGPATTAGTLARPTAASQPVQAAVATPAGEGETPAPAAVGGPEAVAEHTHDGGSLTPPATATEVNAGVSAAAPQSSAGAQPAGALDAGPSEPPPNPAAAVPPAVAACMDKRMLSASLLTHPPVEPPAWVRNLPAKGPGKLKPSSQPNIQQAGTAGSGRWLTGEPPTEINSDEEAEEAPPAPTTLAGGVTVPLGFFGEVRVWVDVGLVCLSRGWPTAWVDTAHVDYACCRCVALAGQGVIAVPSNNLSGICTGDAEADWSKSRKRCLARWLYKAHVFEAVCVLVPVPRNGHWALAVIWHPCMRPCHH